MPIHLNQPIRILSQDEFGKNAFEVMGFAFELHNSMGRFFDEPVYQNALLARFGSRAATEVYIHLTHGDFRTFCRIDFLVDGGAIFELKAVEKLLDQHRQQLIQYLMLTELRHGKLVNFRQEQVQHEFVNCEITTEQRRSFQIQADDWNRASPGCAEFQDYVVGLFRDWGTGLDVHLYEQAVIHRYGGREQVECPVEVLWEGHAVGQHLVRLIAPATAFKITTLRKDLPAYESNLRRFLDHTNLERVFWANVQLGQVTFREIRKGERQ